MSDGSKTVFGPEKNIALALLGTVRANLFVWTLQATCCIAGLLGLLFFAKVLQGAERRYSGYGPGGKPVAQDVDIAVKLKYKKEGKSPSEPYQRQTTETPT